MKKQNLKKNIKNILKLYFLHYLWNNVNSICYCKFLYLEFNQFNKLERI